MSNLPKIYNPLPEKTDFSDSISSLMELKNLSDIGNAIVTKMSENARFAHENVNNNAVLLEQKKKHDVLLGYIENIANEEEKQLLLEEFRKLRKSYDKNSNWVFNLEKEVKTALLGKGEEKLSTFGSKVMDIKNSFVSSLPPFWKGLYDIGMSKYQSSVDRRDEVHDSLENILYGDTSTEEVTNEGDIIRTTNNNVSNTSSQYTASEEATNGSFSGLEDLLRKVLVDKESGLLDTNGYNEIIQGINDENILLNEIKTFAKYASEEEMKLLQELLNKPEEFSSLLKEEMSKISNISVKDGKVFTDVTYDIQNERQRRYYEDSMSSSMERYDKDEVIRNFSDITDTQEDNATINRWFSNIMDEDAEGFDSASTIAQENENDYRRESLEEQKQLNDSVDKIYRFISGDESKKSSANKSEEGGIFSFLGDMAMNFLGGKIFGKILGPIFKSKAMTKVLSTNVGQKVLANTKIGKTLTGMGLGNTTENVTKNIAKESVEKISKESTEALTKKATTEVTESIAKEGAEKVATKAAGKTALKTGAKMGAKLGARAIPLLTPILAAYDGISGWNDEEAHQRVFGLQDGQEATMGQKAANAVANVLDMGGVFTGLASLVGFDVSTDDLTKGIYNFFGGDTENKAKSGLLDGSTKTPSATSQSGGENFTPVNAPKDATPQYNSNSKLNEIYSSHITTKDDGKVIERHVDSVKDIKNEVKEHYKSRGMSDSSISSLMSQTSTADVYNQALLEEVYGKNYSVDIQPQGIYDRNNDMAFTPIVKDDNGIITKILKNPSDHIKKDEEGYVPPNSFMSMSDELSTQYQSDYNTELSTRSMEEQTDRKRLSDLQETSFWSGDVANPELDSERTMLEEKIAKNYTPLQTEVNSNQYTVGAKMSELIDNRVNQTSNIQSVNKPSTSSSTVLQEHPTTSKQGRDIAYTTSSTRSGAPTKTKESQQPPVIVNNNYNTTNNNIPSSSSSNKQTPPPQMIVNPMPASVWSGGGWGGMR